jgi:hypothetical protein
VSAWTGQSCIIKLSDRIDLLVSLEIGKATQFELCDHDEGTEPSAAGTSAPVQTRVQSQPTAELPASSSDVEVAAIRRAILDEQQDDIPAADGERPQKR